MTARSSRVEPRTARKPSAASGGDASQSRAAARQAVAPRAPAAKVSPAAAKQTRELKAFCLSLPCVTKDVKWGNDLCFSVGGKMFAAFDVADTPQVGFKADDIEFERLTKKPGIIPAPYAARFGWVRVVEEGALPRKELERLLTRAHALVLEKLPAKKQAAIRAGLDGR